jgi:hypothetical protein
MAPCFTGYQAVQDDGKKEQPNAILTSLIRVVRPSQSSFPRPQFLLINILLCFHSSKAGGLGIPGL